MFNIAALVVVVFLGVLLLGYNVIARYRYRNICGPKPKFFIGNLNEIPQGQAWKALHEWALKFGPIYVFWQGCFPNVVISDPDLIKEVGIKHFASSYYDRPSPPIFFGSSEEKRFMNSGLLFISGCGKNRGGVRANCEPLFHSQALAGYMSSTQTAINELIGIIQSTCIEQGESIEALNALSGMALDIIGKTAFGVDFCAQKRNIEDAPRILTASKCIFQQGPVKGVPLIAFLSYVPRYFYPFLAAIGFAGKTRTRLMKESAKAVSYLWGSSQRLLQNCRGFPEALQVPPGLPNNRRDEFLAAGEYYKNVQPGSGTLLDRLKDAINRTTGVPLNDMEISAQGVTFILTGYETTSTALTFAMYELAQNQGIQDRMCAEIKDVLNLKKKNSTAELEYEDLGSLTYCEAVFNESMRKYPPVTTLISSRWAAKDCMVGNVMVPKGCKILLNTYTIHRDERFFPDPDVFRPERFIPDSAEAKTRHQYAFIPFGGGARKCIGYRLAYMEGVLTLARLIEKFEFSLDTRIHSKPLEINSRFTLIPAGGVWVKATERSFS